MRAGKNYDELAAENNDLRRELAQVRRSPPCQPCLAECGDRHPADAPSEGERFNQQILDSLPAHVAVLNRQGQIVYVNQPWLRFARENNQGNTCSLGPGADYLAVCRRAADAADPLAEEALEGLRAVLDGRRREFVLEYPCHSPHQQRWFQMNAAPCQDAGVVVTHTDISARRLAEVSLAEAKQRLQTVLGSITDGYYALDDEWRFVAVNPAAARHFGKPPDQLIGENIWQLTGTPSEGDLYRRFHEARSTGQPQHFEASWRIRAGFWAELHLYPHDGLLEVYFADISDRKLAEQALRESERRLQSALAVQEAINRVFQGALTVATEEQLGQSCLAIAEELTQSRFGFMAEVNPGTGLLDVFAVSDPGWEACRMKSPGRPVLPRGMAIHGIYGRVLLDRQGFFTNDPASHPDRVGTPEGHPPLTAFLGVPLVHAGQTVGMIGLGNRDGGYRDEDLEAVTALGMAIVQALMRKRAERALARSAAQGALLVEWTERIVAQESVESLLDVVVEAARVLTGARLSTHGHGYVGGEFRVGPSWRAEDSPPCPPGEVFKIQKGGVYLAVLRDGPSLRLNDAELMAHPDWWGLPDGHAALRGLLGARLVDSAGRPCGVLMVSDKSDGGEFTEDDETRLRQLASITSLAMGHLEARAAAEAASVAKSQFLANMSHEIRTPMTAVLGFTELLKDDEISPEERREYLDTVSTSGQGLLRLIDDILDLSKIEAGKITVESLDCSPRQIVEEVLGLMQVRAKEKGLLLEAEFHFPFPAVICSDPARIRQILVNLVGNAVKFTHKGQVRVEMSFENQPAGPKVSFAIVDTGIGISPECMLEIFNPFNQADPSLTRRFGGTGLGLTISQRLAQMLGGAIAVESEIGQGSRFFLTVDAGSVALATLLESGYEHPPQVASSGESLRLSGRVLLVEDTPANQHLVATILGRAGVQVDSAESGDQACRMAVTAAAAHTVYDLILMDMQMPGMSGYEAVRLLRAYGWQRPIVAITAHAMAGDREKCLEAGCDDYVAKPLSRDTLLDIVARHLNA